MCLWGIIAELLVSRSVRLLVRRLPWHLVQLCGSINLQFRVTWCPTFQRGHVISCLAQDAALSKTNPSGGLQHLHTLGASCRFYKVDVLWTILLCVFLSSASFLIQPSLASLQLPTLTPKLPFRDVTGCHGNCLLAHSPPTEGAAAAAVDQLDSVARQQVTCRSLATTLLQEPANPLNLSLSPSPNTLLPSLSLPLLSKTVISPFNPKNQRQLWKPCCL